MHCHQKGTHTCIMVMLYSVHVYNICRASWDSGITVSTAGIAMSARFPSMCIQALESQSENWNSG